MARYKRFTFYCDQQERALIAAVAERLERSQSDAIRLVMRNVAQELGVASGEQREAKAERRGVHDARR